MHAVLPTIPIEDWTPSQVSAWLREIGVPSLLLAANAVEDKSVDGATLIELSHAGWGELGVTSPVEQARACGIVKRAAKQCTRFLSPQALAQARPPPSSPLTPTMSEPTSPPPISETATGVEPGKAVNHACNSIGGQDRIVTEESVPHEKEPIGLLLERFPCYQENRARSALAIRYDGGRSSGKTLQSLPESSGPTTVAFLYLAGEVEFCTVRKHECVGAGILWSDRTPYSSVNGAIENPRRVLEEDELRQRSIQLGFDPDAGPIPPLLMSRVLGTTSFRAWTWQKVCWEVLWQLAHLVVPVPEWENPAYFAMRPFASDPREIANYMEAIHPSEPMWLSRVAAKLLDNRYCDVDAFAADINLIFDNCIKFNAGRKEDTVHTIALRCAAAARKRFDSLWEQVKGRRRRFNFWPGSKVSPKPKARPNRRAIAGASLRCEKHTKRRLGPSMTLWEGWKTFKHRVKGDKRTPAEDGVEARRTCLKSEGEIVILD